MTEMEIRQELAKAQEELTDRIVEIFRRATAEAYMKGLLDSAEVKDADGPEVKLKPGAILKRKVKAGDFVGCKNIRRIMTQMEVRGIDTYGDLARLTADDVMKWRNFGMKSFDELRSVMKMRGVEFRKQ